MGCDESLSRKVHPVLSVRSHAHTDAHSRAHTRTHPTASSPQLNKRRREMNDCLNCCGCVCACANGRGGEQQGVAGSDPHFHFTVTRESRSPRLRPPRLHLHSLWFHCEPLHIIYHRSMRASLLLTCVHPGELKQRPKSVSVFLF